MRVRHESDDNVYLNQDWKVCIVTIIIPEITNFLHLDIHDIIGSFKTEKIIRLIFRNINRTSNPFCDLQILL